MFKPKLVPREILSEILEQARWSLSWGNTQALEFYVVSGEPLERSKKANREKCAAGEAPRLRF